MLFLSEVAAGEADALIFEAASLACLMHSARIALADCFCADAPEMDTARSAGTSRAYPNCSFAFGMVGSFVVIVMVIIYPRNARLDCTSSMHRNIR
jgi:hypothetical protein